MGVRQAIVSAVAAVLVAPLLVVPAAEAAPAPAAPAPPSCEQTRPTGRSAGELARRCGHRVEALDERTETSQTFVNPDGSRTLEQSLQPERVKRGSDWVPIDPTLRKAADGSVVPTATVLPMRFSPGGGGPMAELRDGDRTLAMSWPGRLPAPTLVGETAVYRNVLPDVDLRVTASALGFSEVLVVKTPKAARHERLATIHFDLKTKGVAVSATADGGLQARDPEGKPVFVAPTPVMWDSSATTAESDPAGPDAARPDAARSDAAGSGAPAETGGAEAFGGRRATMPATVRGSRLSLKPDRALLADPKTKYPVFIDPAWTGGISGNAWTTVWSKYPTSSFWQNSTALQNGKDKGTVGAGLTRDCDGCSTYKIRTYFRMNTSTVRGKVILGAKFRIEQRWSWTCSPKSNAKIWITGSISSSTTWNKQPSWDNNYTASTAANRKVGAVHGCSGPGTIEFDAKSIVARSASAGWSTVTLGMRAIDEGTTNQWKRFNHSSAKLAIDYNTVPNTPGKRWSDGKSCATGASRPYVLTSTPNLAAEHSDPDKDQQSLTTWFHWWQLGGSRNSTDRVGKTTANPATPTVTIPSGRLVDGRTYVWQAYTTDGRDSGGWSGTCEFTVDTTPPNTPKAVTSTDYPPDSSTTPAHGGVGLPGVFQITPPESKPEEAVAYAWTLDSAVQPSAAPLVTANSTTHAASVTITPTRDGVNTLRVWTKDVAGRFSAAPREYVFKVRAGSGPAAAWDFNEASGAAQDVTGHGNTVTLSGSGVTRVTGRGGVGKALSFDGGVASTGGPAQHPHPDTGAALSVRTDTSFTVAARVRVPAVPPFNRAAVAVDGARSSPFWLGYEINTGRWAIRIHETDTDSPTGKTVSATAAPVVGRWTHLAATYDGATRTIRLYVDGVLQPGTATASTMFNATGPIRIGAMKYAGTLGHHWPGDIDDVRIYPYLVAASNLALLAAPEPPAVTFPNGSTVTAGQPINVRFDAAGDTNVTSYKYSEGSALLNLTATPSSPGGPVTVAVPTSTAGPKQIFAVAVDANGRQSTVSSGSFSAVGAARLSGSVIDAETSELLSGVLVTLQPGNRSMTTGANGWYSFADLTPGTYTITATIGGRCGKSFEAELAIEGDVTLDLPMTQLTDDLGYTCAVAAAPFVAADQTVLALTGDDAVTQVALPFAFPFYGHAYRETWVDTNGLLSFTDPGGSHRYGGGTLPAPADPNAAVAAFWDDLVVDASASVRTAVTGTGADQRFIVEWRNVHRKASTSQRLTAEAILAPDGTVTLNYAGLDNDAERGGAAAVGIEGPEGEDGLLYSAAQPSLASGQQVVFDYPGETEPIDRFTLSGVVRDGAGAAVAGAVVTLDPAELSVTSEADGSWEFTGLVSDSYTVTVSLDGRCARSGTGQVELTSGDVTQDVVVEPVGDGFGYGCVTGARDYIEAGNVLPINGDTDKETIDLPFPFRFYGRTYTSATVTADGMLGFAGAIPRDIWENEPLPSEETPNASVYAFWEDLVVDGASSVRTEVFGTAPNRYFVVEWRNVNICETSEWLSVEAVLYENGEIAFNYAGMDTPLERGGSATVGIESHDGQTALQYSYDEEALVNGTGILFTPPAKGTIQGTVTATGAGTPVSGATVTLQPDGTTTTTDADGGFQFTNVPASDYTVAVARGDGRCAGPAAAALVQLRGGLKKADLSVGTGADGYGNTCTVGPRSFIPAEQTVLPLTGDDKFLRIDLPFPVTFYGTTYTAAWVDTNGVVSFEQPEKSSWNVSELPSLVDEAKPNASVYAFWEDWIVDSDASVRTAVTGTAPNRQFVIEWRNVLSWKDRDLRVTFEAVLAESGEIAVTWSDIGDELIEQGGSGVVGIEDASGEDALVYSSFVPTLRNGAGVVFHPGTGQTGTVQGTVTCAGTPTAGVSVVAGARTASTGADGGYTLTDVPAGATTVVATAASGACAGSAVAQVSVSGGATVAAPIALVPADGGGYRMTAGPRAFTPANATVLPLTGDDVFTRIDLPFPVPFYGATYTEAWVDTNGVVSFVEPDGSSWDASPIPSPAEPYRPNASVYAFWEDWIVDSSASVRTAVTGTAPNRQLVIEWRNVLSWADRDARVTFETVLGENGDISVAWQEISARPVERGAGATVGVENAAGSRAHQFLNQHPVIRSGDGVLFHPVTS